MEKQKKIVPAVLENFVNGSSLKKSISSPRYKSSVLRGYQIVTHISTSIASNEEK